MRRPMLISGLVMALLSCLMLTTSCGETPSPVPPPPTAAVTAVDTPPPPPSAPPAATEEETPAPAHSPSPSATPPDRATAEPPLASDLPGVDLGLPGGDCFQIQALASDREGDRVYVLCSHTDQEQANAVAVVDAGSGQRLDLLHLGGQGEATGGQLALDTLAGRLYALSHDLDALIVLELETLSEVGRLRGVSQVLAAPGSGRFYALSEEGLVAHSAADLSELNRLPMDELSPLTDNLYLAYNPVSDQIYAAPKLTTAGNTAIQVRGGADLSLAGEVVVTGVLKGLAVDGGANRFYVATEEQFVAVDGESLAQDRRDLDPIAADGGVDRLVADEEEGRLHVLGTGLFVPSFWLVVDGATLETLIGHQEMPAWNSFGLDARGNLLAAVGGTDVVSRSDPETGQPLAGEAGRLVLGVRVLAALPHPDDDRLFVVDSSGAVQVLDGPSLQVLDTRPGLLRSGSLGLTAGGQVDLAVDPEGNRLYVADLPAGETHVLDLEDLEPSGTLDRAGDLAVDVEGRQVFVADFNVYVFDTDSLQPGEVVEGEIAVSFELDPDQPSVPYLWADELLFDAGSQRLLVRSQTGGSVHVASARYGVYAGDTMEFLGSLSVDQPNPYLQTPVLLPGSGRLLLAYTSGGKCRTGRGALQWDCRQGLVFFDDDLVEMGQILGMSGRFLTDQAGQPGDDGVLYLWRDSSLAALDPEHGYPLAELGLEGEMWDLVLAAGQSRFYHWAWDRLQLLPTSELLDLVPGGRADLPPLEGLDVVYASPGIGDDVTLFAAIPARGLYRSTDGGDTWQVANWGLQDYYLGSVLFAPDYGAGGPLYVEVGWPRTYRSLDNGQSWLPDGPPRLAFVSDRSGNKEIYTAYYDPEIALLGSEPQRLTDDPAQDDNPAWSPQGARLAFQSDRSGNNDLWIMNWDGSGLVQLTGDPADDLLPAWSPDGEQIAFVSLRDGNPDIYVMRAPEPGQEADESTVRRLTQHPAGDWRPAWNSDGTRIAFASTRDGDNEIYVLELDSAGNPGALVQLTDDDADDRDPAWRPGSEEWISFLSDRDGNFDVYAMSPQGESVRSVTHTPFDESHVTVASQAGDLLFGTEQTGNADLYHWQPKPTLRRLTRDPAGDTAPAWNPWVLVAPQALRATATASPTPTPIAPVPTPAATRAATPAPLGPAANLPVLAGTPLPTPRPYISAENVDSLVQAGHWGGGKMSQIAYAPDGKLVAVLAEDGIYLYDGQSLEPVHYARLDLRAEVIAFGPDSQTLATDWGRAVRLWDVGGCLSGTRTCAVPRHDLQGHSEGIDALAFSPDGETLASGSTDETVRFWRVSDGSPLYTLEMPKDRPGSLSWVESLAFSPDGETLATALFDYTVRLWRVSDGQLLHTLEEDTLGSMILAFCPDGTLLATTSKENKVRLWRVADGTLLASLEGHQGPVLSLDFEAAERLLTTTEFNVVRTWDVAGCAGSGAVPAEGCGSLLNTLDGSSRNASAVAFAPDHEHWVSFDWSNILIMWGAEDGQLVHVAPGYTGWVNGVTFSPDGSLLAASAYGEVVVWRVAGSQRLGFLREHEDLVTDVAFSPDGALLASASGDDTVQLWSVEDWNLAHTLEAHTGDVLSVAFAPDSKTLASSGWDGTIRLWRAEDGFLLHSLEGGGGQVYSLAISPDGSMLASGSEDGSLRLWAMDSCADPAGQCGRLLQTLIGHGMAVIELVFSPDGRTLASGSDDNTARLWAVGECPGLGEGCGRSLKTLTGHEGDVDGLAFSPDGLLLATASGEGALRFWDTSGCASGAGECGALVHVQEGQPAYSVAFAPDGTLVASNAPWTIQLWVATAPGKAQEPGTITPPPQETVAPGASPTATPPPPTITPSPTPEVPEGLRLPLAVISPQNAERLVLLDERDVELMQMLTYSPDGNLAALATTDGIRVLEVRTMAEVLFLRSQSPIADLAFSPNGGLLASGQMRRGAVELWDMTGCLEGAKGCGSRVASLVGPEGEEDGQTMGVAFGPDGPLLASTAHDDTVRLWDVGACLSGAEGPGCLLHSLTGHTSIVYNVSFAPDGQLAVSTSNDGTVRLWDVGGCMSVNAECGREAGTLEMDASSGDAVAFSPDGVMLALGANDGTVHLWDLSGCAGEGSGCGRPMQRLEGHTSTVESLAFNAEGSLLVSGDWDETVRIWDVSTCASGTEGCARYLHSLVGQVGGGYPGAITTVAFRPDGKVLAMAEGWPGDYALRLWGVGEE